MVEERLQRFENTTRDFCEVNRTQAVGILGHALGVSQQFQPFGRDRVDVIADRPSFRRGARIRVGGQPISVRVLWLGLFRQRHDDVSIMLFLPTPDHDHEMLVVELR